MIDRATASDEHSELSYHLDTARETVVTHAPVLKFTYRDALVRREGYATRREDEYYEGRLQHRAFAALSGPIKAVQALRYCHSYVSWRYFGHWLTDAIPSALIDPNDGALFMPPHPDWDHAQGYLDALDLDTEAALLIHAEKMTVYQDFGQGSHKQARYAKIRDSLHKKFGSGGGADNVYIRRGSTGVSREIANEDALIDALSARNWQILDIATATFEEVQRCLCRAGVVVSIDGSHLDHAHLALGPGAVMVVLAPYNRFSTRQLGPARAHGVSPGFVVLQGNEAGGYFADPEEILRTVALAETMHHRSKVA